MAEGRDYNLLSAIEKTKPMGQGPFGPIFDQFVGRTRDAIELLIKLKWNNEPKKWLLTAFEKKNSVPDNTTDTGETSKGMRNDTATPQNTVSVGKGSDNSETPKRKNEFKSFGTARGVFHTFPQIGCTSVGKIT